MDPSSELHRAVRTLALTMADLPDAAMGKENWAWLGYDEGLRNALLRSTEELLELAARGHALRSRRGPAVSEAQRVLGYHHRAFLDVEAALIGVDDALAAREPAPGEWPVRTVVGHMVRSEAGFHTVAAHALHRFRAGQTVAPPADQEYERWCGGSMEEMQAQLALPLSQLWPMFVRFHTRVLHELAGIRADELDAPSLWWEETVLPLRFRLHRFGSHLRQHTAQLDAALAAVGHLPTEARRLIRHLFAALAEVEAAVLGTGEVMEGEQRALGRLLVARAQEIAALV